MASAAPEPVRGEVDSSGRLLSADPRLARLQEEAGGDVGAMLAVPQLAAIARLASQLGISLSRQALAATSEADLDLWVRAEPSGAGGVALSIESWVEKPPRRQRFRVIEGDQGQATEADLLIDPELRIKTVAAAFLAQSGRGMRELREQPITRVFELLPSEEGDLPLLAGTGARRVFGDQRARIRPDGRELSLSGTPRSAPDGEFLGFSLSVTWTERPSAAGADQGTQQAFDDLLRQPLDVIMGEAERISEKNEGPLGTAYAGYAADIAAAARHLLDVLQSMSTERSASAGTRIDLAAIALEATGLVQAQAMAAGVTFDVDGPPSLPGLGEARSVTQILVNLIGNAVRHSPRGGVVRVHGAAGQDVSITVADDGPGIAPADQARIFERFEQAEPRADGAGLGLAISRRYARQLGGDITVESTPGAGARFTLRLPAAP